MSEGEERLRSAAKAVSEIMLDGKFRLSLAESFTGGAVSAALVGIAGTSGFLLESAVCYSNEAKCLRLGVKKETLASYGAVFARSSRRNGQRLAYFLYAAGFCRGHYR